METADKNTSNTEGTSTSHEGQKSNYHPGTRQQDAKLLLVINNRMPIISDADGTANYDNATNRLQCISPKTRLILLAGTTILTLVSAMCFLLVIRLSCSKPRELQQTAQNIDCTNESLNSPLDNFFGYDVSLLILCNRNLGICLATIAATLLSTAIYLRHPVIHKTKDKGVSRNNVLRTNLVLLIIGLFACINLILLACYDLTVKPQHLIFVLSCFGSFIVYELGHNCCLMNDILRNRKLTWRHQSKDSFRNQYVIFTSLALILGVASCLFAISGSILRLRFGQCGSQFQWMAIISISGFFVPVYLLIVIRDYLLYHKY